MKTAVIMTGQARSFARCLPSMQWEVFRFLKEPHFFLSVAQDSDADSVDRMLEKYPGQVTIEKIEQPILKEPPLKLADHAPYAITPTKTPGVGPLQGILRQLWHLSRGYTFAMEHGAGAAMTFIRCRFDLHFQWYVHEEPKLNEALIPWWGNFGGTNDRFAVMGWKAAEHFFKTWDNLPEMLDEGAPVHPESLVSESMRRNKVDINRTLQVNFGIRRKDGELVHPTVFPHEVAQLAAKFIATK